MFEKYGELGKQILLKDFENRNPDGIQIINLYIQGYLVIEISKLTQLHTQKISDLLTEYGHIIGERVEHQQDKKKEKLDINSIISEYRQGKSMRKIAEETGTYTDNIRRIIFDYVDRTDDKEIDKVHMENNKKIRKEKNSKTKEKNEKKEDNDRKNEKTELDNEKIYLEHKKGKTLKALAEKYKVSVSTIKNRINDYIIEHDIDEGKLVQEGIKNKPKKVKTKKIATRYAIENMLKKYKYSYEELNEMALKTGRIIPKEIYDSVIKELNEQRKGEDR